MTEQAPNPQSLTLLIDPELLRPFQPGEPIVHCSQCDKQQARWTLIDPTEEMNADGSPKKFAICAICFLYESRWGVARRARLDLMIKKVEADKNQTMLRDAQGRVLSPQDADKILAGIALTSRFFSMSAMSGVAVEDEEEDDEAQA